MYALSQLKIQPSTELWEVWQVATIGKINEFTTQELTNSIYSLTILSALTQNNYLSTVKVLRDAINKLDFNQLSIEGVIQIWTGTNLLQALFNDQLLEEEKYKSISEIINSNPLNPMTSNLQESMFKVIANKYKGTPTKICSEYWIPELATRVDICVVFENNEKLVIQIDGPSHFIGNGKQHNAATEINTLFLNILGYTTVRIPYYEVNAENSKIDILMQLFKCIDNFTTSEETKFDQHSLSNNSELFSEVPLSAEDSSYFDNKITN
ncbi:RAP domain-containing protein [Candidatus Tisiphia endosymbiont of Sialis lutaria]|uniref:RAP domain-containing protein n=1 Tax=Candidatus Tisiphia endosymbiont of Sialis lutaria TaxID=2029164 RepID=UPI00312CAD83